MMTRLMVIMVMLVALAVPASASHWEHILTYKALYRYPPKHAIDDERKWWADHYDMVCSTGDALTAMKHRNSGLQGLAYVLDITVPQKDAAAVERYAKSRGHDVEELYLHFLEDTVIETVKGNITVKGSQKKTRDNRVEAFIWSSRRYVMNLNSPVYREYYNHFLNGFPLTGTGASRQDGFFVDEHGPGMPLIKIKLGGGILEYNGMNPVKARQAYNNDVVAFLSWQMQHLPKDTLMIVNTAEYVDTFTLARGLAVSGTLLESIINLKRPHPNIVKEWNFIDELVARGKTVVVNTAQGYNIPKEFSAGNYRSTLERARLFSLAYYYLAKDPENRLVYFQLGGEWNRPFADQWFKAQEVNVGRPVGTRKVYVTGKDPLGTSYTVYSRDFTNALVLFRPKENWKYDQYAEITRVDVKLPAGGFLLLREDGTTAPVMGTSIELRNAEAVILLKAKKK